jgi:hypothetical protein
MRPLGKNWVIELRGPKRVFQLIEEDGRFTTCKGQRKIPDLVVSGPEAVLLALFGGGDDWRESLLADNIEIQYRDKGDLNLIDEYRKALKPL